MSYVPGGTNDASFAVYYHIALKAFQTGAVLGVTVVAPVVWLVRRKTTGKSLYHYVKKEPLGVTTMLVPAIMGLGYWRLRVSKGEMRVHRLTRNRRTQLPPRLSTGQSASPKTLASSCATSFPLTGRASELLSER